MTTTITTTASWAHWGATGGEAMTEAPFDGSELSPSAHKKRKPDNNRLYTATIIY